MGELKPLFLATPYQDAAHHGSVILRDGSTAVVRAATPADAGALRELCGRLSPESRYQRFFSRGLPDATLFETLCDDSEPRSVTTLLVTRRRTEEERVIASASFLREDELTAEFAVVVDDAFQGKGLGAILLERLAQLAALRGFVHFRAVTQGHNVAMLEVFRRSGFQLREGFESGYVTVDLAVLPSEQSVVSSEMRDRVFTTASLRPFFQPRSVAVVGASPKAGTPGARVLDAIVRGGYEGVVYPINPEREVLHSTRCYASIRDLPERVDLAVLVVPPDALPDAIEDCAAGGVRALLVVTPSPTGDAAFAHSIVERARSHGMRLVGPGSLGAMNTDPALRLNATVAPALAAGGRVAMASQSGAIALGILALARRRGVGFSTFLSMGEKGDVSGNDLLQYWERDEATDVILLYLEGFKNARRFARIARRVARSKPIVYLAGGARPASAIGRDHGAALARTSTAQLFGQLGVIQARTLREMFDLALALSSQPLPAGRCAGVVTNARGPGLLCAEACAASGLSCVVAAELDPAATAADFAAAAGAALAREELDALIAIYVLEPGDRPALETALLERVRAARRDNSASGKTVLAVSMTAEDTPPPALSDGVEAVPRYAFPEEAVTVLARLAEHADWLGQPPGLVPDFADLDPAAARATCREAIRTSPDGRLSALAAEALLLTFGLRIAPANALVAESFAPESVELRVLVVADPTFGPLLGLGVGGRLGELVDEVAFRVTPLTDRDARELVRAGPARRWIEGRCGREQPADTEALEELLLRVSLLAESVPELTELVLDPLVVLPRPRGCAIGQASVRAGAPHDAHPFRYVSAAALAHPPRA